MNIKKTASVLMSLLLSISFLGTASYGAETERASFDADVFRLIPVYHQGRVKPLDTYANLVVEKITTHEKTSVKLNLVDYYTAEQLKSDKLAGALEILPEGKLRKFKPAELIMSWLAEPEKWEHIPFINASHKDIREALGLPLKGPTGVHLKFASPHEIITSIPLRQHILDMQSRKEDARAEEKKFEETPLDKSLWNEVLFAYALFREVTFDPRKPVLGSEPLALVGARDRFMQQVIKTSNLLTEKNEIKDQSLTDQLSVLVSLSSQGGAGASPLSLHATQLLQSFDQIRSLTAAAWVSPKEFLSNDEPEPIEPDEPPTIEELEPSIINFTAAAKDLSDALKKERDRLNEQGSSLSKSQFESIKPMFQEMYIKTTELVGLGEEMHLSLYENSNLSVRFSDSSADRSGSMLAVVPALNAQALANSRDTTNLAQPWLGMTSILYGSDNLLQNYDKKKVQSIRSSWNALLENYRNGKPTEEAQKKVASALRALGEQSSAARADYIVKTLSEDQLDDDILAYSAYPPSDGIRISTEVMYNDRNPFMMCWIICLGSVTCFSLAFGRLRKWMFWGGILFLLAAIAYATFGFYMRVVITGWAPVTNMYETVVFVPWFICVMGFLFLMLPLVDRGRLEGWRATAFPFTWEATTSTEDQLNTMSPGGWNVLNFVSSIARIPMMIGLFYFLVMQNIYDGNQPIFTGMNPVDLLSADSFVHSFSVYVVKLISLVLTVWVIPRVVLATVFACFFCLKDWFANSGISKNMPSVYERSYFGVAASVGGTFFFCIASYASANVLNENFSPLMPILRSNVWLTIHVLTIVASYGAGMLAWMLGVLALGYYMFGKYRKPVVPSSVQAGLRPASHKSVEVSQLSYKAPEQCYVLGNYCYRAIQVAVLLLATGTILGGLWADVSWGRFWGWDPKEVWALISLLVYLAILHGRFAGMFHNFGLIVGTILGFSAIVFSWYGVNFMLPMLAGGGAVGLHSYGSGGAGGTMMVVGFVLFNFLYLGAAALRFHFANIYIPRESDVEEVVVPEIIESDGTANPSS